MKTKTRTALLLAVLICALIPSAAHAAATASVTPSTTTPVVGQTVTLDAGGSTTTSGNREFFWFVDQPLDSTTHDPDTSKPVFTVAFSTAGTHTVDLVVGDGITNETSSRVRTTFTVQAPAAAPAPAPDPGPNPFPGLKNFLGQVFNTLVTRPMPNVVGKPEDAAKEAILAGGVFATYKVKYVEELKSGQKSVDAGEVASQTPAKGTSVTSAIAQPAAVTLSIYTGKEGKKACRADRVESEFLPLEFGEAMKLLPRLDCGRKYQLNEMRFKLTQGKAGSEASVTGFDEDSKGRVTMKATHPPVAEEDLFASRRSEGDVSGRFASFATDWQLTSGVQNRFGVQVVDRGGRLVSGVRVFIDDHEVVETDDYDVREETTGAANGTATVKTEPDDKGTIKMLLVGTGANGVSLYGHVYAKVRTRAGCFETLTGSEWCLKKGDWKRTGAASSRAFASQAQALYTDDYLASFVANVRRVVASKGVFSINLPGGTAAGKLAYLSTFGIVPAQLAVSNDPSSVAEAVAGLQLKFGPVIATGGGNIIGQDTGSVISTGGGNFSSLSADRLVQTRATLIGDHGTGLIGQAGGNVISVGGANIQQLAKGGKWISNNTGNVISAGRGNVIATGAGNIISDNGGGLIGQAGGN